jgi:hypothetical protein
MTALEGEFEVATGELPHEFAVLPKVSEKGDKAAEHGGRSESEGEGEGATSGSQIESRKVKGRTRSRGEEGRREGAREWRTERSEGVEEGSREKEGGEELRVAGPKGQVEPAVEGMREKEEKAGRREAVG